MDRSARHNVEQKKPGTIVFMWNSNRSTNNQSLVIGVDYLGLLIGKCKKEHSVTVFHMLIWA